MAQLSEASSIPVATIKLYLREGLLSPGARTSPNQAQYGLSHLRRLKLIQVLVKLGRLSLAAAGEVLDAIDSDLPLIETFGIAQRAATRVVDRASIHDEDLGRIDALIEDWHVHPDGCGRYDAAAALTAFRESGLKATDDWYRRYADAALAVAEADLDLVDAQEGRSAKAETVVVGTVLGDAVFAGLRRAAQEHVSYTRYAQDGTGSPPAPTS
ncbi:MerR family transcriptional regulator [Arthrobacter agilis]|uniref:MerR family transcriptional regulator n=1 Tax=Arthrobacter agilis TaxID=37921 RepID=UPI00277EA2ED|nr:MerR family transcriptional regulator [Arthrobacter agilis]MDQ0736566.1 DNA-binding transcriptional MerR regulator [Arthrobacter agilis]